MIVFSSIYNNLVGYSNNRYCESAFCPRVNLTILIGFMRILRIAILIYITLIAHGCSVLSDKNDNGVYTKSKNIKSNYNIPLWKMNSKQENADLVFEKNKTGSLIIVNSNCRKNNLSSLQSLKASLLAGIDNFNLDEEKKITLHERDALEVTFNGSLDGVKRFMTLTIFQRDFCIYDMILISKKKESHKKDLPDYERLTRELFEF